MVFADSFTFGDLFLAMIAFFFLFMFIWMFIAVFADIFRRNDISGWGKAAWILLIVIVPFIGVLIYLIARPKMTEQDQEMLESYEQQQRRAAGYSSAAEIERLTKLRADGTITEEEFQDLKRKAM
jgi:predicted membrane channel-forming protein YqfA (hemolysin III family)